MEDKKSVYQIVTDNIIALLDKGVVPWRRPWRQGRFVMPVSVRGHRYRGINVFILAAQAMAQGYRSPIWLTYKQANELGGGVIPAEKATLVVFWKMLNIKDKNEYNEEVSKRIPLLRYFYVFNYEQTAGVKLPKAMQAIQDAVESESTVTDVNEAIEQAEAIVAGYENAPEVRHIRNTQALYRPAADIVEIADMQDFFSAEGYYDTLFHEFGHSTGHASRLNRKGVVGLDHFGSGQYAEEELVAELTAAYLCGEAGIDNQVDNEAAYIASWKAKMQADPRLIVQVAAQAQKAADHILGRHFDNNESEN